jgi:hypothetical protein
MDAIKNLLEPEYEVVGTFPTENRSLPPLRNLTQMLPFSM